MVPSGAEFLRFSWGGKSPDKRLSNVRSGSPGALGVEGWEKLFDLRSALRRGEGEVAGVVRDDGVEGREGRPKTEEEKDGKVPARGLVASRMSG